VLKKFIIGCLSIFLFQNCNFYKTIPINLAESRMPLIEKNINLNDSIDYNKMTWEESITYIKTPNQAQDYLNRHFSYDSVGTYESFKKNHLDKKGNCVDYAFGAASLLIDDGFPPIIIGFKGKSLKHLIYVYKTEKGFSALGNTPVEKRYPKIMDLIQDFENQYDYHPKKYFIINLNENFPDTSWINSNKALSKRIGFWNYERIK